VNLFIYISFKEKKFKFKKKKKKKTLIEHFFGEFEPSWIDKRMIIPIFKQQWYING
jgi:hypothetical protein